MSDARARRRLILAAIAVLAATCLAALWFGLELGGTGTTLWVDDLATPFASLTAFVLCARAGARHSAGMRLFWSLLALATACWTAAEVIWAVYELILDQQVPVPSWADVGYLSAIPIAIAALLVHPAIRGSRTFKARAVLDGLVIATALLLLSWTLVLGPLWNSTDLSTAAGVVTLAYPFGDIVIVFFIVLVLRGMTGGDRVPLWCLLASLLVMAVCDSTYAYVTEVAGYQAGNLLDAGWIAGYLGIALAAFSSTTVRAQQAAARRSGTVSERPTLVSLVAPLLIVLLALVLVAVEVQLGNRPDNAAWVMTFALIALVLVRQALLVFELLAPGSSTRGSWTARLTSTALDRGGS